LVLHQEYRLQAEVILVVVLVEEGSLYRKKKIKKK